MTRGSIASILARGAPLPERLAAPDPQQHTANTAALLDRWRGVFDSATQPLFDARLASIDLSLEQARLRLGGLEPGSNPQNKWVDSFLEAFSYSPYPAFTGLKLPFASLWAPVASFAHDLAFRGRENSRLISESASRSLSQSLLEELCRVAAEPVYLLFEEARARGQRFEEFVGISSKSEGERIFDRFPALLIASLFYS